MPSSTFSYTSADGTQIAAYRWDTLRTTAVTAPEVIADLTSGLDRVVTTASTAG